MEGLPTVLTERPTPNASRTAPGMHSSARTARAIQIQREDILPLGEWPGTRATSGTSGSRDSAGGLTTFDILLLLLSVAGGQQPIADAQDGRDAQHDQDTGPPPAGEGAGGKPQKEDKALEARVDGLNFGTAERTQERGESQRQQEHRQEVSREDGDRQAKEEDSPRQPAEDRGAHGIAPLVISSLVFIPDRGTFLVLNRIVRGSGVCPIGKRFLRDCCVCYFFVLNVHFLAPFR